MLKTNERRRKKCEVSDTDDDTLAGAGLLERRKKSRIMPDTSNDLRQKLLSRINSNARMHTRLNNEDYLRILRELPDPESFEGVSRCINSGPLHAKIEQQLRLELGLYHEDIITFEVVEHETMQSQNDLKRFLAYRDKLPENYQEIWAVWHGIKNMNAEGNESYHTESSRFEPLDPRKVIPNAHRHLLGRQLNRLHDGIYFASHLAYNIKNGFFEICPHTGALKILECLILPGHYQHVRFGSCPHDELSSEYNSRIAYESINSLIVLSCIKHPDAIFVRREICITHLSLSPTIPYTPFQQQPKKGGYLWQPILIKRTPRMTDIEQRRRNQEALSLLLDHDYNGPNIADIDEDYTVAPSTSISWIFVQSPSNTHHHE